VGDRRKTGDETKDPSRCHLLYRKINVRKMAWSGALISDLFSPPVLTLKWYASKFAFLFIKSHKIRGGIEGQGHLCVTTRITIQTQTEFFYPFRKEINYNINHLCCVVFGDVRP
jgi:hypothetical protein